MQVRVGGLARQQGNEFRAGREQPVKDGDRHRSLVGASSDRLIADPADQSQIPRTVGQTHAAPPHRLHRAAHSGHIALQIAQRIVNSQRRQHLDRAVDVDHWPPG